MSLLGWQPPADILHSGTEWCVKLDISGIKIEDIDISVDNNILIITGTRRDTLVDQNYIYHLLEIHYSKFERTFTLPFIIDSKNVRSTYHAGMLIILINELVN